MVYNACFQAVQQKASWVLGEIGDSRAVEPLIKALGNKSQDASARVYAADALGKIGDSRAVESLIKALGDESSDVRENAAKALGKIGDSRAIEPLKEVTQNDNFFFVRGAAKEALKKIQKKR